MTPRDAAASLTYSVHDELSRGDSDNPRATEYVLGTQQSEVQLADDGVMTPEQYSQFESELVASGHWRVVYATPTAKLLKFQE